MDEMSYYWIAGAVFVLSLIVQQKLKSTYRTWSAVRNSAGVTGAQTAHLILDANQMPRVTVGPTQGKLTDHYNPRTKEIRLSEAIYAMPSVAAMAIAAHESGHAIQDAVDYTPLELRSRLAPLAATGARNDPHVAVLCPTPRVSPRNARRANTNCGCARALLTWGVGFSLDLLAPNR